MQRVLIIGNDADTDAVSQSPHLQRCSVEIADGCADALQRVRDHAVDVVLTNPLTTIKEDLALVTHMKIIRPGIKTIILTPEATPEDVIAALRAHVFACFSNPINVDEVAAMIAQAADAANWNDGIEVMAADPNWISLRVNCRLLTADRLTRFMTELRSDLIDADRSSLLVAFREILLNAMEHGAGLDPDKVIDVSAVRTKRAVVYHFRDPGPGFKGIQMRHAAINNPPDNPVAHLEVREAEGIRPGGFGILIAQQLVDELVYNEHGNEALLIKHTGP